MKKKVSIVIIGIVSVLLLGVGVYQSNASQGDPNLSTDDISQMVLDQYPGTITEIELETDFNKAVYEVEVVSDGKEYELKLDGNTGEVLKLKEKSYVNKENEKIVLEDHEDEKANDHSSETEKAERENHQSELKTDQDNSSNKKTVITSKRAVEIAQDSFAGRVTELELDKDDGRLIYEVDLRSSNEEAEIEIDAYTGEVLVIEIETNKSNKYNSTVQDFDRLIGAEKAIEIAQEEFGGRVTELELDKEDGRLIYEVELMSEKQKAEMEIDAYTGEVVDKKIK